MRRESDDPTEFSAPADGTPEGASAFCEVHTVAIATLRSADSPRLAGLDADHVRRLAELDGSLPPILVHRPTMRVIDGMHRLRAATLKGADRIQVVFFDGSGEEAFLRAVEENVKHGLPLPLADRKAAAERILTSHPELSDRAVSAATGLSARTVGAVRAVVNAPRSDSRIGADGRSRPLDRVEGRRRASEIIAANPDAPVRQIAKAAGISLGTAHDVRQRIRRGEDPLEARRPVAEKRGVAGRVTIDSDPVDERRDDGMPVERTRTRDLPPRLQTLMKDPSVRYTGSGRELIRWLSSQMMPAQTWSDLVEAVPSHWNEVVAEFARESARFWTEFAHKLERRDAVAK